MTVFKGTLPDGSVRLLARAAGPGAVGDLAVTVRPGRAALGKTYAEWSALPDGPHEVEGRWDS